MDDLLQILGSRDVQEELKESLQSNFEQGLRSLCENIAKLPFQLAYRFLHSSPATDRATYLKGIAQYGGACADKMLLLRTILTAVDYKSGVLLGGFGARERLSPEVLLEGLQANPDEETYPHMYHTALVVYDGENGYIAESSGGRVGCFIFDCTTSSSLLTQALCLRCVKVSEPLYYHRFPVAVTDRVVLNKLYNVRLIWNMIQRVGVAVIGKWTLYIKEFADLNAYEEAEHAASPSDVFFMDASAMMVHPFGQTVGEETISLYMMARDRAREVGLVPSESILTFRLRDGAMEWGKGSHVIEYKI